MKSYGRFGLLDRLNVVTSHDHTRAVKTNSNSSWSVKTCKNSILYLHQEVGTRVPSVFVFLARTKFIISIIVRFGCVTRQDEHRPQHTGRPAESIVGTNLTSIHSVYESRKQGHGQVTSPQTARTRDTKCANSSSLVGNSLAKRLRSIFVTNNKT